jgi:hypothetical protein
MAGQRVEFSLRQFCREIWDELGGCDYHVLAKEAARRVAPADSAAAFDQALIEYARHFAVQQRPPMTPQPAVAPSGAGQRNSGRSSKVRGVREAWPELRARIFTKDGQKALGKCTAADLTFHADLLETQAGQLQVKAGRERELAALLKTRKAACVEKLPDDVLRRFFRQEGA